MARPIRNNAEYFTHPAGFRNDRRVKAIRAQMGAAGYGLMLMLLEALTDADYTQLNTEELEVELLAGDFGVSATEINSLLQAAEKFGLFTRNEAGNLICPELNKWLEPVFDKRNRARNSPKADPTAVSVTETLVPVTESTQSKVKKSKGEESKGEESKEKDVLESGPAVAVSRIPGGADAASFSELSSASRVQEDKHRGGGPTALAEGEHARGGFIDKSLDDEDPRKWEAIPRDIEMVNAYLASIKSPHAGKGQIFWDFYQGRGWVQATKSGGSLPIRNWRAVCNQFGFRPPAAEEPSGSRFGPAPTPTRASVSATAQHNSAVKL